jgi:hypothetical protein
MKKLIFWIFVFGMAAVICWLLIGHRNPPAMREDLTSKHSVSNVTTSIPQVPQNPPTQSQYLSKTSAQTVNISTTNSIAKPHTVEEWMQREYGHPMEFYGKVVDENETPINNASIAFEWANWEGEGQHASASSDSLGLFSLKDVKGKNLGVNVSKEGYYSREGSFEYADPGHGIYTPDSAKPVVFRLHKRGIGADLIHGSKVFGSRVDGTLSYVDLTTSKNSLTPPGDLTVQFVRSGNNAQKFDWSFKLGAVGGGIIESTNEFMFEAPEDGYQPFFENNHKTDDPDWVRQEKHNFYVKSQDGKHYSRIEITIIPYYQNNAAYDLNWYLNPNSSRDLEPKQ